MPRPVDENAAYIPGLDGIRALAVIVVVAYHLGVPHMGGGLLGVGVFFTLSGFLITGILLSSWYRTDSLELKRFWLRRARRLLPAVVVVLVVVLVATAMVEQDSLPTRWGEGIAALFYVANWTTIARGESYFDRFAGPGPLDHLWSLAVEEQFYLFWPVLLLLGLVVLKWDLKGLIRATLALTAISFGLLALLASPGFDNTRAYEGTDTRAGGLLVGALLAMLWRPLCVGVSRTAATRLAMQAAGLLGLAGIGWLVVATDQYSSSLYRYGLLLLSLFTALLVAAAAQRRSFVGRMLGVAPLRWCGERSYGIYLWHLAVVAFIPASVLGDNRLLWGAVLIVLTLALAELSWRAVENPIRRHGLLGALRGMSARTGRIRRPAAVSPLLAGALSLVLVGTVVLSAGATVGPGPDGTSAAALRRDELATAAPARDLGAGHAGPAGHGPVVTPVPPRSSRPPPSASSTPEPKRRPTKTSCAQVVHVGDSTSIGLNNANYLPARKDRLPAQLRSVGVTSPQMDISGARSIVERYRGQPNAQDAVNSRMDTGYAGCWTIAMGTNEAANQAVGGVHPVQERIDLLMKSIGDHPVLWLTVKTRLRSGPYADGGMQKFSDAAIAACDRYPNLRVYDWRTEVKDGWFISDGIHFSTSGYRERAHRIALALASAFPAGGTPAPGCVVHSTAQTGR